jgi:hypothetical protein
MNRIFELENKLQKSSMALLDGVKAELDMAKDNLSAKDYHNELTRIAWVNRGNSSCAAHSTTNLAQNIWRQEALDRLRRWET